MITSKNYNSHRLPHSIGHCPWSLRRVSRNALPILPLNPLKGTRLLCWSLVGASHLPGTDFYLDSFVVTETSLVMKNSLGLQPPSQAFCVTQTQELPKTCSSRNIQILKSNPTPELGDISVTAPIQSASRLLALPPAPSQGQIESKNVDDTKTKLSKILDA